MSKYKADLSDCEEMILSILLDSDTDLTLPEIMAQAKKRFKKDWKNADYCDVYGSNGKQRVY